MRIDRLFIDRDLRGHQEAESLITKVDAPVFRVDNQNAVYDYINAAVDPVTRGKKTLYITRNKGAVIRKCPGTCHYTCCDYTILHAGTFCSMDCSYCILQAYFHPPVLQYFVGAEPIRQELETIFSQKKIWRIGTGEFTDSLIWEKITPLPAFLVKTFADRNNAILELKTKTVNIESLLSLDHNKKTILAWSLNTPEVIRTQEKGTASLSARLETARQASEKGYPLAFHFDPIVIYPGCEDQYQDVIDRIFAHVRSETIVWISLGTFRFMPGLKQVIETRFPDSTICYGEFIPGRDHKMRYFKPLRIRIYQAMIARIRMHAPDVTLYFCMEDEDVWKACMGFFPGREGELGHLLDQSAVTHCDLDPTLL